MTINDDARTQADNNPRVNVEYCFTTEACIQCNNKCSFYSTNGACDYSGHCLALGQLIRKSTPNAVVFCKRGRQGAFEVEVNDKLVYSKLQTMALPDFNEVAQLVNNVSQGEEPTLIKGQQPINCVIS